MKKLAKALEDFCPGRFEITISGNDDEWYMKVWENYSYTGEGSGEEEGSHVIFEGTHEDIHELEKQVVKLIGGMEP